MKKRNSRSFFSGVLATLLVVTLVGTAAATMGKRTLEVDYKNIHVVLDNAPLDLNDSKGNKVEPFAYNGTNYIPVRAVSEALGYGVEWYDYGDSASIVVSTPKSALTPEYPFTGVPRLDRIVGQNAFNMSAESSDSKDTIIYQYYKPYFKGDTATTYVALYQKLLEDSGFKLYKTSTVDGYPMYHFVNDSTKVFVSLATIKSKTDQQEYVSVWVNTEQQKTTTGGGTASTDSSSGGSNPSTPAPDNSAAYQSELSTLDSAYATSKAAIQEQYKMAYQDYMRAQGNLGPNPPDSAKLAVEANYESARMAIDKQAAAMDTKYNFDVAALKAKYGM